MSIKKNQLSNIIDGINHKHVITSSIIGSRPTENSLGFSLVLP